MRRYAQTLFRRSVPDKAAAGPLEPAFGRTVSCGLTPTMWRCSARRREGRRAWDAASEDRTIQYVRRVKAVAFAATGPFG